jgi:hypothetical protein
MMNTTVRLASIRWGRFIGAIFLVLATNAGMASQPPAAAPAGRAVYWCPMHPNIRGTEGDTCPVCKMALVRAAAADYDAYLLDVEIAPRVLRARQHDRHMDAAGNRGDVSLRRGSPRASAAR